MSEAPFMQLYVADYLGDTRHLTTEQHGAYLLLLMTMWRNGGALPNDTAKLSRIAGVSARRWHLICDDVMAFFTEEGAVITQKRLVEEYQKAVSKSEKRSVAGKLGGEAKALKNKGVPMANAKPKPKHSSEPEPYRPTEPKGSSGLGADERVVVLKAVLDDEHADALNEHRKLKGGKTWTVRAAGFLAKELGKAEAAGFSPNEAAEAIVRNGWQGFEVSWLQGRRSQPRAANGPAPPKPLRQNERLRLKLLGEYHDDPIQPDRADHIEGDYRRRAGPH